MVSKNHLWSKRYLLNRCSISKNIVSCNGKQLPCDFIHGWNQTSSQSAYLLYGNYSIDHMPYSTFLKPKHASSDKYASTPKIERFLIFSYWIALWIFRLGPSEVFANQSIYSDLNRADYPFSISKFIIFVIQNPLRPVKSGTLMPLRQLWFLTIMIACGISYS